MNEANISTKLNDEITDHINNPKNYGQIYPSNGVGMGFNPLKHEFVIFYLYIEDEKLENVGYGANAGEEAIVLASMFSEMIKDDSIENTKKTLLLMKEEIQDSTTTEQKSAKMVLTSFEAALINYSNLQNGIEEAMHKLSIS